MGKKIVSPLVINASGNHTHTMIILHGRGSNAERFAHDTSDPEKPGLLHGQTSSGETLQQALPGLKFVFPTAPLRRCTARKRMKMNIWFDSASFEDHALCEELHIDGLVENARAVGEIVRREAEIIGWDKVFLGGISEGCAMALYVLMYLKLENKHLAGLVGLSGWLPFQDSIERILSGDRVAEDVFVIDTENSTSIKTSPEPVESDIDQNVLQAAAFMVEEIMERKFHSRELLVLLKTPIFIGHGSKDEAVPVILGRRLANSLQAFGFHVSWNIYQNLGHWFECPTELDDMARFLRTQI